MLLIPAGGGDALVLYRGESAYNSLVVEERAGSRRLLLNDERFGIHSVSRRDQVLTGLYYDAFYVAPILAGGRDVLVLGMAGGTTVRGYRTLFPGARVTAVEIDPRVVEVARRYFWLADGPDLDVHVRDARPFLSEGASRFDVIEADLFAGGVYAPFYVVTREFFELARGRLRANGVIVVNALAVGGDDSVARAVAATMATVFPSVFELPLRNQRLLFGFAARVDLQALRSRLDVTDIAGLGDVLRTARARLRDASHSADDPILTDDWAPIEQLTDRMMKRRRPGADPVPSASR
jgi:spermidine synthase